MPVLNGATYIEESIRSILDQTYSDVEVLVIDGGSTDETETIVQRLSAADGRVRWLSRVGQDMATARNSGLRAARGELIALLDSDDLWMPNRLADEVPLFETPDVGLVHAGIEFFTMENSERRITYNYFPGENIGLTELLGHTVLGTQTLLFRRSLLEQVGGFDESMPYTSDWETCIGVAAIARVVGLPQTLGMARVHTSQSSRNRREMFVQGIKALDKNRHLGADNPANQAALQKAEIELREEYARALKEQAKDDLKNGSKLEAAGALARSVTMNPQLLKQGARRFKWPLLLVSSVGALLVGMKLWNSSRR